ncbi:hypothetical protein Goari_013468 [Gossypium aridum]|uniref:Uncharacterized protein n=2 Tax=Gossypium TaxID=3633 RepID=A0A7J8XEY3_GOSAI|nr:hypothetical protein [Gossypium aridum]
MFYLLLFRADGNNKYFWNVFDPRQMRVSVQGSGVYINRERGYSIDPIHIDDPLFPTNNVGRNCFRIHQCIKAFSEAYSILEDELSCLSSNTTSSSNPPCRLLQKIIPTEVLTLMGALGLDYLLELPWECALRQPHSSFEVMLGSELNLAIDLCK